jgi:nucleotide-binding universal stress UspA family protein
MYGKIIVGHDVHEGGEDALALGTLLAEASGAGLVVAGVFPFGTLPRGFDAPWREEEERIASELDRIAKQAGAEAEAFPAASPARGLQGLAEEVEADLIVVGSSRHSPVGQVLAGNVGTGLLTGSPCAVSVAPRGYRERAILDTIVVGFDGSAESRLALRDATELATATDARLRLVAVMEPPSLGWAELREATERELRDQLTDALVEIPGSVDTETEIVAGDPAEALAEAGRAPGSLMLLGSRAYGPVRRVLLGSVSAALVRSAPCPVIVHPRGG